MDEVECELGDKWRKGTGGFVSVVSACVDYLPA